MKRSKKNEMAHRRRKVAEWALKGWSQQMIAATLGVSQPTITRDLEAIRIDWRESGVRHFEEARGEQLQKLDLVETEAWAAWQRSQNPIRSASINEGGSGGKSTRSSLTHKHGDPRFLDQINKCIAQRCLLLGLQPAPLENKPHVDLSLAAQPDEILSLIVELCDRERADLAATKTDQGQPGGAGGNEQPGEVAQGPAPEVPQPDPDNGD